MNQTHQTPPIKTLTHQDLDLSELEGQLALSGRLGELAKQGVARRRARMLRLGVIDTEGHATSDELPVDMRPQSTTSTDT